MKLYWQTSWRSDNHFFQQILEQHKSRIGDNAQDATCLALIETADLFSLRPQIEDYGERYLALPSDLLWSEPRPLQRRRVYFSRHWPLST